MSPSISYTGGRIHRPPHTRPQAGIMSFPIRIHTPGPGATARSTPVHPDIMVEPVGPCKEFVAAPRTGRARLEQGLYGSRNGWYDIEQSVICIRQQIVS